MNPGPVASYMLPQSRLAQQDVGGAGGCCFIAVPHQLYDEPNYHMNIHSVGVQYMRNKTLLERLLGRRYVRCILACRLVQSSVI